MSSPVDVLYGVLQGSVLGPKLFEIYTLPIVDIACKYNLENMDVDKKTATERWKVEFLHIASPYFRKTITTTCTLTSEMTTFRQARVQ